MKGTLLVLGCVAYLFWPYDIIPDVLPGLGWIDDLLVLAYLLAQLREGKIRGRRAPRPGPDVAFRDPYEILGIRPGAESDEIKKAYRRMIAQYHPDKVAHLGEEIRETAHRKTLEIQRAYEELCGD